MPMLRAVTCCELIDDGRTEKLSAYECDQLTRAGVIEHCANCECYHIDNGADWEIVDQCLAPMRECSNSLTGGQQF